MGTMSLGREDNMSQSAIPVALSWLLKQLPHIVGQTVEVTLCAKVIIASAGMIIHHSTAVTKKKDAVTINATPSMKIFLRLKWLESQPTKRAAPIEAIPATAVPKPSCTTLAPNAIMKID